MGVLRRKRIRLAVCELESRTVPTAGELDVTFAGDGKTAVNFPPYQGDEVGQMILQSDGKVVMAGKTAHFSSVAAPLIVRLNADGTKDSTFGDTGKVTLTLTGSEAASTGGFGGIVQQPDGKFVAVGAESLASAGHDRLLLARFNNDGTLDTTFADNGMFLLPEDGSGSGCVALQSDGKIVVAGNIQTQFIVIRFAVDGTLDSTFDNDGVYKVFSGEDAIAPGALRIQGDGKIVIAGSSPSEGFALMRLNTDGTRDTSFGGGDGFVRTTPPNTHNQGFGGLVIRSDGKLVGAGTVALGANYSPTPTLLRFNTDGSLDTTLAGTGYVLSYLNSGAGSWFGGVALQSDGKAVAVGSLGIPGGAKSMLIRYLDDGSFDSSFGTPFNTFTPGVVYTDMASGDNDGFGSIAIMSDGRIVAAGTAGGATAERLGVARYLGDPFVANDDSYSVTEDTQLAVNAPGVMGNDVIFQGNPHAVLVDSPAHALQFSFSADGSFSYTPESNFVGTDTFTYKLVDGSDSSPKATVTLSVQSANDPPVAFDDSYELPVDSPASFSAAVGVLANDTDSDGDTLHAVLVSPPAVGTLDLDDDGSFAYAFPADFSGSDTFTYKTFDGIAYSGPATVTLTREGFASVDGGTLKIMGTSGSDIIRLRPSGHGIRVELLTPVRLVRQTFLPQPGTTSFTLVDVDLGSGNDRLDATALRIPLHAVGGPGNDLLRTGRGDDMIFGDETDGSGSGADVIEAGNGDNTVAGGNGSNVIRTGHGDDVVTAGDGDNSIGTGGGHDLVTVGNGRNEIDTSSGNDTVTAGTGGSLIDAGSGEDLVVVAGGNNWIQGGSGKDVLIAGDGNDLIEGEGGNDLIIGGSGTDQIEGGSGNDILFDGTVALVDPVNDSFARILSDYHPSDVGSLQSITSRLIVTFDTNNGDTLLGGNGTDWFWSDDLLDVLDIKPNEPHNAVP